MSEAKEKRFILWDPKKESSSDQEFAAIEEGRIHSNVHIGQMSEDNVYLTEHAGYRTEGEMDKFGRKSWPCTHRELEVGEWTEATFNAPSLNGTYQIWRVR